MIRRAYLSVFILLALISNAQALDILDSRITTVPLAKCPSAGAIVFRGRPALIKGASLQSTTGTTLFKATDPVLDAVWAHNNEFILTSGQLVILGAPGKKPVRIKLPGNADRGRLLLTSSSFVSAVLARNNTALVITMTAKSLHIVAEESDFSASALDRFGNVLLASTSHVYAISRSGKQVPVFRSTREHITNFAVLPDNSLLIVTDSGLIKLGTNRIAYPLIKGAGELHQTAFGFAWCEKGSAVAQQLRGIELPGEPESDRTQLQLLLKQASTYLGFGQPQQAYLKVKQALVIAPNSPQLIDLAGKLRRATKPHQNSSPAGS